MSDLERGVDRSKLREDANLVIVAAYDSGLDQTFDNIIREEIVEQCRTAARILKETGSIPKSTTNRLRVLGIDPETV